MKRVEKVQNNLKHQQNSYKMKVYHSLPHCLFKTWQHKYFGRWCLEGIKAQCLGYRLGYVCQDLQRETERMTLKQEGDLINKLQEGNARENKFGGTQEACPTNTQKLDKNSNLYIHDLFGQVSNHYFLEVTTEAEVKSLRSNNGL